MSPQQDHTHRLSLMLQGAAVAAQLLPLLRFLQAAAHHASKPAPEPELLPTAEDYGLPPVPTDKAAPAVDAGLEPGTAASESASAPSAGQTAAAAASAGGNIEAAAEAGGAAGEGPGAAGAAVAPVAPMQGADEESGESEVEDMDEDEDVFMGEDVDDEGDAGAEMGFASAGLRVCLRVRLLWACPGLPSTSWLLYLECLLMVSIYDIALSSVFAFVHYQMCAVQTSVWLAPCAGFLCCAS